MPNPNATGVKALMVAASALALFLAVVMVAFFGNREDDQQGGQGPGDFDPLALQFKQWPVPAAAFLLTGEQHGYIEPCGCTENQSGGVSRRGDLMRQMTELKWKTAGLDLGGLVKRDRMQSQLKFETLVKALKDLNYKAIGLGPEEIRLKPDYLLSQHDVDTEGALRFLAANVTFYDAPELGTPAPLTTFEHGGLKFGVTSVTGTSWKNDLRFVSDVTLSEPADAIPGVVEKLEAANVDLKFLMVHGTLEEAKALADEFPAFDLVLATGGPEDPDGQPIMVGETMLLNVGKKGKYAGVLGIYPDSEPRFRFELVQLDRERFGDTPGMIEHMRYYQSEVEQRQLVLSEPAVAHPSGAEFVGSAACAECHEEEYDIWKASKHASAFASLDPANKRHGYERLKGVPRMFDPECLCCHVTGWHPQDVYRYQTGFINEAFAADEKEKLLSPLLVGSGCENCHGPGSRHIELANDGEDELAAAEVRLTIEQARSSEGCYKCHDLDNSPTFKFDKYWPDIKH